MNQVKSILEPCEALILKMVNKDGQAVINVLNDAPAVVYPTKVGAVFTVKGTCYGYLWEIDKHNGVTNPEIFNRYWKGRITPHWIVFKVHVNQANYKLVPTVTIVEFVHNAGQGNQPLVGSLVE